MVTLKEAESSYLNAGQVLEELYEQGGVDREEKRTTELKISTALSRYTFFIAQDSFQQWRGRLYTPQSLLRVNTFVIYLHIGHYLHVFGQRAM